MKEKIKQMNKKLLFSSIFIVCFNSLLIGQTDAPKVIPPSPEAQTLFKFLDYPVNNSSGVPEINIPLYTIKHGDIEVPISISYHASGRKVTDGTGPIGLGWSLKCGGMITRTIYGKPDGSQNFIPAGYKNASNLLSTRDYRAMASIYYPYSVLNQGPLYLDNYDSEYDIYNFYCGTSSGKFIYDHKNSNKVILFPPQPISIGYADIPSGITDGAGFAYEFGESQSAMVNQSYNVVTGRYLTSITSPNKKTKVTFLYQGFSYLVGDAFEKYTYNDDIQVIDGDYGFKQSLLQKNGTTFYTENTEYSERRITEINFEEGKVIFNMEAGSYPKIANIQIKDNNGVVLKTIVFVRSFLDGAGSISNYKLDDIIIKDNNNVQVEKYHFEYFPSETFTLASKDYWGYRNGTSSGLLIPYYNIYSWENGGYIYIGNQNTDRTPHSTYAQKGVLKKITYPTGGSTEFTYESNLIVKMGSEVFGPGLRIQQIKNTDNYGRSYYKTYTYEPGYIPAYPDMKYNVTQKRYFYNLGNPNTIPTPSDKSYNERVFYSDSQGGANYQLTQPVVYSSIREYNGTIASNSGYTLYGYQNPSAGNVAQFSALGFSYCGYPYGGPIFGVNYPNTDSNTLPWYMSELNLWNTSRLQSRTECANNGNNTYRTVKSTSYNYNAIKTGELTGLRIYKFSMFPLDTYDLYHETSAAIDFNVPVFMAGDYSIPYGRTELASVDEIDYTNEGQVKKTMKYFYNENNLVRETRDLTSNNEEIITNFIYPFDSSIATTYPYNSMVSRNILTPIVEKIKKKGTTHLQSVKTNYQDWGNDIIAPQTIDVKNDSYNYETYTSIGNYDIYGHVLQSTDKSNMISSYFWGYNQTYPVAKFENISHATVSSNPTLMNYVGQLQNYTVLTDAGVRSNLKALNTNIRNQLSSDARVTTYTYSPLIGMTSQTDPNGITTYYEYDSFGRLKNVKDHEGNILKQTQYHYQNQP